MHIQSIGIIGYGQFGKFLHTLARAQFLTLKTKVYSRSHEVDHETFYPLTDVCQSDILILCVPISVFKETVDLILPSLGPRTIVCDVATIKKYTVDTLRAAKVPRFISIHPMFGPYSYAKHGNSLENLRIAVCESTLTDEENQDMCALLRSAGLHILTLTADEHDKLVAETLFLTHLVGQTVTQGGFERTAIDTVSFGFLMDAVESVAHDEQLFRDVFHFNPHCKEVLARFEEAEQRVTKLLESN
jgi:prephenate dehydrogenase